MAVTLCHLTPTYREDIWRRLSGDLRVEVRRELPHIDRTTSTRTKQYAAEVKAATDRMIRIQGREATLLRR